MPLSNLRRACRRFRCPYVPACQEQSLVCLIFLPANELLMKRSTAIEMTVYDTNGGTTSPAYRTKMRSLYLNLKGKENPSLREGVVSGDIPVAKLCTMTSQVGVDADDREPYHPNTYLIAGHGLRGTKANGSADPRQEFVRGSWSRRATGRNRCISMRPLQAGTNITFTRILGILKVPRSARLYIDKRRPALPMSL